MNLFAIFLTYLFPIILYSITYLLSTKADEYFTIPITLPIANPVPLKVNQKLNPFLTVEKGHSPFENSSQFFTSNFDILVILLIIRFNIISSHTFVGFKNPCQIFHFGCHGNSRPDYPISNFLQK